VERNKQGPSFFRLISHCFLRKLTLLMTTKEGNKKDKEHYRFHFLICSHFDFGKIHSAVDIKIQIIETFYPQQHLMRTTEPTGITTKRPIQHPFPSKQPPQFDATPFTSYSSKYLLLMDSDRFIPFRNAVIGRPIK